MAYEIEVVPAAARQLRKIKSKKDKEGIASAIRGLATDQFPNGFSSVAGLPDFWRIKSKDYRIVYTINEEDETVVVARIAHRREVYKRLADVAVAFKVFTSKK